MKKLLILFAVLLAVLAFTVSCKKSNDDTESDNVVYDGNDGVLFYHVENGEAIVTGLYDESATTIVVPSEFEGYPVTTISYSAFHNNKTITEVVISDGVLSIERQAFFKCTKLESVSISDTVATIGDGAFYFCEALYNFKMGTGLSKIGTSVFVGTKVKLNQYSNGNYIGTEDNPYFALVNVTRNIVGDLHDDVVVIADVFEGNYETNFIASESSKNYKTVDNTLYSKDGKVLIRHSANSGYTSFEIPNGVVTVRANAFCACIALKSIIIPNTVTTLEHNAFKYCMSLTSVEIPNTVSSIENGVFAGCTRIMAINVDSKNKNYKSIDGNLYTKDGKTLVQYAAGKTDTEFTIPNGVVCVGEGAFSHCASLKSIEISNSVITLSNRAFYSCESLTSMEIPSNVTYLGDEIFYGCTDLISVQIPDSVATFGNFAFRGCSNPTIYVEASEKPDGWHEGWNFDNCPVVWGYTEE